MYLLYRILRGECIGMAKVEALEEELVELKLKKRNLILANKDIKDIDNLIKDLEEKIIKIKSNK